MRQTTESPTDYTAAQWKAQLHLRPRTSARFIIASRINKSDPHNHNLFSARHAAAAPDSSRPSRGTPRLPSSVKSSVPTQV
jgi:hypothetical protein